MYQVQCKHFHINYLTYAYKIPHLLLSLPFDKQGDYTLVKLNNLLEDFANESSFKIACQGLWQTKNQTHFNLTYLS